MTVSEFRTPADRISERAPYVEWDEFSNRFHWKQGQHLALIGPTNSGKTTLATALLPLQPFVTVLATKPRDDTMDALKRQGGYKIVRKWKRLDARRFPRRILWPPIRQLDAKTLANQRHEIQRGLHAMYAEGGWCVYVDELWYLINTLKLDHLAKMYLLQARSLGISFTVATQRPAFVPLEVYDQSTHLFFWRDNDERNLSRLSGISWRSQREIRSVIANLTDHEFLYVNTRGEMLRSRAPFGKGG